MVRENNAAVATSFGVKGVDNGDERGNAEAVLAAANAEGGVLGRRIEAVYYTQRISDANKSAAQLYSETCSYFTEDHATRIVLYPGIPSDQLWSCLQRHQALGIAGSPQYIGDRTTLRYPVLAPNALSLERQMPAQVAALSAGGFFAGQQKYGLLSYDEPKYRGAVSRFLKPALRARGITLTAEFYLPQLNGLQDQGAYSSAAGNAVLKFRSEGVTRVIDAELAGGGMLYFMRQADAQQYRPRYGMTSAQGLNALVSNVPTSQLKGAVALAWRPSADLPSDVIVNTPGRARCLRALSRGGIRYGANSSQEQMAQSQCDMIFAAVDSARAARATSPDGLLLGAGLLGDDWRSAAVVQASFAGRRDAVSGYRVAAFTDTCSCFTYVGPPGRIS